MHNLWSSDLQRGLSKKKRRLWGHLRSPTWAFGQQSSFFISTIDNGSLEITFFVQPDSSLKHVLVNISGSRTWTRKRSIALVSRARSNGVKGVEEKDSSFDKVRFVKLANNWVKSTTGPDRIKPECVPVNGPAPEPTANTRNHSAVSVGSCSLPQHCCIKYPDGETDDGLEFSGHNLSVLGFPFQAVNVSSSLYIYQSYLSDKKLDYRKSP